MTPPESPAEPSEAAANTRAVDRRPDASVLLGVLAAAAQALAEAPADPEADDAALTAILGRTVVPVLGDVVALYVADAGGDVRLIGAAPADATPARRLIEHVAQHPEVAAAYAAAAEAGRPSIVGPAAEPPPSAGQSATTVALRQATGLVTEIVAPLGADPRRDGLLVVSSTDPARRYDDADRSAAEVLAAIVGARRTATQQAVRAETLRQQVNALALAGRELAHLLNNDLTLPVGVVELLLDRSTFAPDLQEMLQASAKDLAALEQHVRAFHDLMREHSSSPGA